MYGHMPEKTIWTYWYHHTDCKTAGNCTLPAHVALCVEAMQRNRGGFEFKVMRQDEVLSYVNALELPLRWRELTPQHQKDAVMNALLARYGGVAMDITTVLLRPIDDYWDEMISRGATFRGYVYRLNGNAYRHPEVSAVWFLMSRREGIFSTAVRNQVIGMGDRRNIIHIYHQFYYALGDQTLLPILSMFNYNLPKCFDDQTLMEPAHNCPENEQPNWYEGISGPPRNDTILLLRDPRDGPQLPFAMSGAAMWHVSNSTSPLPPGDSRFPPAHKPGGPMYDEKCSSMKECWDDVFIKRYYKEPPPGEARLLSFVKLFSAGKDLQGKTRQELLADNETFFYKWLELSGLPKSELQSGA